MSTTHHLRTTGTRLGPDVHRRSRSDRLGTMRRWARTNGWKVRPINPLDTPARRLLTTADPTGR